MFGRNAQVATEYIVITGFLLAIITVIFAYSYTNYDQAIKTNAANAVLDALVNKADYVYALGPDNNQLVEVVIPKNVSLIGIKNICKNGDTTAGECDGTGQNGISRSAINLTMIFGNSTATVSRVAKSAISLEKDSQGIDFPCKSPAAPGAICDGKFTVKAYWNRGETKVFLKKV